MKKRLIALIMCGLVLCGGCGKSEDNKSEDAVTEMITKSASIENNTVSIEKLASVIGKNPCYVSEREVCEDFSNFPEGVCTDFSYFTYANNEKSPYIAQKFLEGIGVSKENERLIVKYTDDNDIPISLVFLEYKFDDDVAMVKEHYFSPDQSSYEENLEKCDGEIYKSNSDALYVATTFRQVSLNYDAVLSLDETDGCYEIIW